MTKLYPLGEIPPFSCRHASAEEYFAFVQEHTTSERYREDLLHAREKFVRTYPDLSSWFSASLSERVGARLGRKKLPTREKVDGLLWHYLLFLGFQGYAQFDWECIIAMPRLRFWATIEAMGFGRGVTELVKEAVALGFEHSTAQKTLRWAISRIFLHTGTPRVESIRESHLTEFSEALRRFGTRTDIALFYGSLERYLEDAKVFQARLHQLHTVLYHRGQIDTEPAKKQAQPPAPTGKPRMQSILDRYLAARRLTDEPATVSKFRTHIRRFISWIEQVHPTVETFAQVTRDHILEFAEFLTADSNPVTSRPLTVGTRRQALSNLSVFFQDVAFWQWADGPSHPLLKSGDLPKLPQRVPRYIPDHELDQLMPAIREVKCPYQRAALLIARWSGARREEIQRLTFDCLDSYPDGTPRLRIPAGKTKRERMIPLNQEAAEAICFLQQQQRGRGLRDRQTGIATRYLFLQRGKLLSLKYLFGIPLQAVCLQTGLVEATGKATVTPHRFRHTVGTQLARRGAHLRTIQKMLGHESAAMSMVYIGITDEDVRQDYQAVLGPGALIAGPGADLVRSGALAESEVDWLKSNFFKTELELGHCLRLPQEGPCECDLYLSCAKFVTSLEYAPRLRHRRRREQELVEDALAHGWQREVERHQCTIRRLEPPKRSPQPFSQPRVSSPACSPSAAARDRVPPVRVASTRPQVSRPGRWRTGAGWARSPWP